MLRTLFALAALVLSAPALLGATGPDPPQETCITIQSELRLIREMGAGIETYTYRGDDALHMKDVLLELGAPAETHEAIAAATAFLLMIGGENADPPALLKMFGADNCAIIALGTDHAGAARLKQRMGLSL